jgi:hypothetical protein
MFPSNMGGNHHEAAGKALHCNLRSDTGSAARLSMSRNGEMLLCNYYVKICSTPSHPIDICVMSISM